MEINSNYRVVVEGFATYSTYTDSEVSGFNIVFDVFSAFSTVTFSVITF